MKRLFALAIFSSIFTFSALSQNVVASVTSTVAFTLDGKTMNTPGVVSHPLVSGDTVTTGSTAVTITLSNGQTATIAPNSSVQISGTSASPAVYVTSGSLKAGTTTYTPSAPVGSNISLWRGSCWN